MDEPRLVALSDIVEPKTLLRLVDKNSIAYLEMRDSIERYGFTSAIAVRPAKEPGKYEFIDGLHRFCIAQDLGLPAVPCIVKSGVTDDGVLILQIQANAQTVPTRPVEYARGIKALLMRRPSMTEKELAVLLKKSPFWINTLLGLLRLPEDIQKSVDRGEVPVISGYMLSRMPHRLQRDYLDHAKALPAHEFRRLAAGLIKTFREAVQLGSLQEFYARKFSPQPYLRHLKEIQAEVAHHQVGPSLVASLDCHTPLDGFYAALRWVTHLDPQSVEEQRQKAQARERNHVQDQLDADDDE